MPLRIRDIELSGFTLPSDDVRLSRRRLHADTPDIDAYSQTYDFKTLFYDCFLDHSGKSVVLIGPPPLNLRGLLTQIDYRIDGELVRPSKIEKRSRCVVVELPVAGADPRVVTLSHDRFGGNLPIGASYVSQYKGTNAIFALSKNNDLAWIKDWLHYNHKVHGANAVVFADNQSTDYSCDDLKQAVAVVDGIKAATIVRARYRFGPTDEKFDSALFLQRALAEVFRQRFLLQASAVVNTDVDELFHSFSGRSIFDATVESSEGYVRANARWVYTSGLPDKTLPRHGDHGCVTRNGRPKSNRKYAVAPTGPQAGNQWLTHFIHGRRDPVDPDFELWHFRDLNTGWKVDRSHDGHDLVPYTPLQTAMSQAFGASTKTPAKTSVRPRRQTSDQNKLIITAMKNEASYILEWVAYHRAIGFTNFLVYTNDCSDCTVALLQTLETKGYLTHQENRVLRRGPQKSALKDARTHPAVSQADWVLVSDIDEFLNIHIGRGTVDDLIDRLPGADAIPITWKLFGNDGLDTYTDAPIINTFFDAEAAIADGGIGKRFAKTLFRPTDDVTRFGTHGPIVESDAAFTWMAPNGKVLTNPRTLTRPKQMFCYDIAQINHYAVGSVDAFLVKRERGRVNHYRQSMDLDYWQKMNRSGAVDKTIQRHAAAMTAELDKMLEDPQIRALHEQGVQWRHERIADLKQDPDFAELRKAILATSKP